MHDVAFVVFVTGVGEAQGQVAVVGEQEKAFAVQVKPADAMQPRDARQITKDGGASLWIVGGGDESDGLVVREDAGLGRVCSDGLTVEHDVVLGGDAVAECGLLAVDGEASCVDPCFSGASGRSVPKASKPLLQAFPCGRRWGVFVGHARSVPARGTLGGMLNAMDVKYADLLLDYSAEVKPGDVVSIHVDTPAVGLARALVRGALERDAVPRLHLAYPELNEDIVRLAGASYVASEPDVERFEVERADAWVRVAAPTNRRALQGVDPARLGALEARMQEVQALRVRDTRWVSTLYPTAAGAQDAGMGLDDFEAFTLGAMHLFDDDPQAAWRALSARQAALVERLSQADEVRIEAEGTDLTLRVGGRTWVNSDGKRNMPSGEVFTGPIETSAEGTVHFDVPSFVAGQEVRDVRLRFEEGVVVEASAAVGEALLLERLEADAGARRLGEIGIGTNNQIDRPTGSTLFDEKIGGTVHLALGRSYTNTGGVNESRIHWDLIRDLRSGGRISLDGAVFQENGVFRG